MNSLEVAQATRGDIAEFRHQTDLRFAAIEAKFPALEASFKAAIADGIKEQTRFFFLAWAVLLATIVGLYAR